MIRAVFLDRDGTLIVERNYLSDPAQVELLPGVPGALKRLQDAGFRLFIVTNQSGIGRGYYTLEDLRRVNARLLHDLAREEVHIEHIYYAPEAPDQPSRGRKPSPQFLFDARDEFGVDLARSYMVGDKLADVECGWNAGVRRSILVRTGYGAEVERRSADKFAQATIAGDLPEAAAWIVSDLREVG